MREARSQLGNEQKEEGRVPPSATSAPARARCPAESRQTAPGRSSGARTPSREGRAGPRLHKLPTRSAASAFRLRPQPPSRRSGCPEAEADRRLACHPRRLTESHLRNDPPSARRSPRGWSRSVFRRFPCGCVAFSVVFTPCPCLLWVDELTSAGHEPSFARVLRS